MVYKRRINSRVTDLRQTIPARSPASSGRAPTARLASPSTLSSRFQAISQSRQQAAAVSAPLASGSFNLGRLTRGASRNAPRGRVVGHSSRGGRQVARSSVSQDASRTGIARRSRMSPRSRGRPGRRGGRGRGAGRGGRSRPVSQDKLDADLERYMMKDPQMARSRLDQDLDNYMMDVTSTETASLG